MKENEQNPQDGGQPTPKPIPPSEYQTVDFNGQNGNGVQNGNGRSSAPRTPPLTQFQNRVKTALGRVSTSINRASETSKVSPLLAAVVLGLSAALLIVLFRPFSSPLPTSENQTSEQRKTVAEDWFQQAREASDQRNHQSAIDSYTQAIQRAPNNSNFRYNRGVEYAAIGNRQQAINDYTEAIKLDKNFADAYYNRANANAALGKKSAAIVDYQRAANLYQRQGLMQFQQEAIEAARTLQQ